jgi:hypothetical protein
MTEPTFFCLSCRDEASGWRPFACPGRPQDVDAVKAPGSIVDCGRHHDHLPHGYVARCECWGQNPVVERRKAWAAKKESAV